jgi:hypothetical protein
VKPRRNLKTPQQPPQAAKQAEDMERAIRNESAKNYIAAPTKGYDASEFTLPEESAIPMENIRKAAHAALDAEQILGEAPLTEAELKYAAFMEEKVVIIVHEATNEEELNVVSPMVNGMSQPIVRGHPTAVKRKYVEVLARAKETKYRQEQLDASKPDSLVMIPRTVLAFPFSIERDDNPNGRAWLRDIVKQPA